MNQKSMISALAGLLLSVSGCTHSKPRKAEVNVTVTGIKIDAPGFLMLNKRDLQKLTAATMAGSAAATIPLSENRKAVCASKTCTFHLTPDGIEAPVSRAQILDLVTLNTQAEKAGEPVHKKTGPITLKCTQDRCTADAHYQDSQPHRFTAQTTLKAGTGTDYPSLFLQSLLRGMIQGAVH